jgi:hypothetical protein
VAALLIALFGRRRSDLPEIICAGILVADVIGWPIHRFPEYGRLELVNNIELHTGGWSGRMGWALLFWGA